MSDVLGRCENVSKVYCRDLKRSLWYGVRDIARDVWEGNTRRSANPDAPASEAIPELRTGEFWANRDISFEVQRGECLGLIGRNGAGKTTLLKMLNGLIRPDTGRIEIRGQVGALIALGAGFNPVLTGRENISVNGSILGLSRKQVEDRFEEIVEFSELSEFIDTPVQNYSSGMRVRLGFSIAAVMLQPDVLLLDEVLAVGDMSFTLKCLNTVQKLTETCAVILVSHQLQTISRFCTSALVLDHGRIAVPRSSVTDSLNHYMAMLPVRQTVFGNDQAVVTNTSLSTNNGRLSESHMNVQPSDSLVLQLTLTVEAGLPPVQIKVAVEDPGRSSVVVYRFSETYESGTHHLSLQLGQPELNPGSYALTIVILTSGRLDRLTRLSGVCPFTVQGDFLEWASVVRQGSIKPN